MYSNRGSSPAPCSSTRVQCQGLRYFTLTQPLIHRLGQDDPGDSMQPYGSSIGVRYSRTQRVRAGIVLYIAPLGSAGNHNASPRREGLERRNLASRSLLRACFGPINVEFRGGAICEAYRGRPAGLARSRRFAAAAGDQATTHRARARILRLHTRTTPPRTLITHNLALRGALDAY